MSRARPLPAVQTWAAWTVAVHGLLLRFAPEGHALAWLALPAALGGFAAASPVRAGRRVADHALGAVAVVAGVSLLRLLVPSRGTVEEGATLDWALPWAVLLVVLLLDGPALARLRRLLGVEWLKTRRGVLFRMGLVLVPLVTLLGTRTYEWLGNDTGWSVAAHTLRTGFWGAGLFVLVLGATALSGEATGGTLKMMIPHAYRRSDWILAKGLVLALVSVLFTLVVAGTALAYAHLTFGLGEVHQQKEEFAGGAFGDPGPAEAAPAEPYRTPGVMAGHVRDVVLSSLGAVVATGLLALFLSSLFDAVVASLSLAFLSFLSLEFVDVLTRLPETTMHAFYTWYPATLTTLSRDTGRALAVRWNDAVLPEGLRLALLTGSLAVLLAITVFDRRDLQA